MPEPKLHTVAGEPSWHLRSSTVDVYVARVGGHVGPVTFDRLGKRIRPMALAPWANEAHTKAKLPPMLRVLRGDFFCMPFGGNDVPYRDEKHPPHGETANRSWTFKHVTRSENATELCLTLKTRARAALVTKTVRLVDGHDAVYQEHVITGTSGPMNLGHHAMLQFPPARQSGKFSTSRFVYGQVFPKTFENPEARGYQYLQPGATFDTLTKVPAINGSLADLTTYPARRGYEDLVSLVHADDAPFAWNAVVFPSEGYVWFALKDPRILRQTVLWFSNGGRHYAPWNSRHTGVLGIEEVTSYFHEGLAASAKPNAFSRSGWPTTITLSKERPTVIRYVFGVAPIRRTSSAVTRISSDNDGIHLWNGKRLIAHAKLDVGFVTQHTSG